MKKKKRAAGILPADLILSLKTLVETEGPCPKSVSCRLRLCFDWIFADVALVFFILLSR